MTRSTKRGCDALTGVLCDGNNDDVRRTVVTGNAMAWKDL